MLFDDDNRERDHAALHVVLGVACGIVLRFVLRSLGHHCRRTRVRRWAAELWLLPRRASAAAE